MDQMHKRPQLRAVLFIGCTKDVEEAAEKLVPDNLPVFYLFRGQGTASSEMMDMLGLGCTAKTLSITVMKKPHAEELLKALEREFGLALPGTGIAFTIPISGVSALTMKIVDEYARRELFEKMESDAKQAATCSKHSLIAAVVNQGYSEDVMDAAKEFGARGGTVIHSRQVGGEAVLNFLGIPIQEEKDLIFIIVPTEDKVAIMQAIGEKCGMHSEAQGIVVSTPIDSIVGLG